MLRKAFLLGILWGQSTVASAFDAHPTWRLQTGFPEVVALRYDRPIVGRLTLGGQIDLQPLGPVLLNARYRFLGLGPVALHLEGTGGVWIPGGFAGEEALITGGFLGGEVHLGPLAASLQAGAINLYGGHAPALRLDLGVMQKGG